MYIIYKITNRINNKSYIGQTNQELDKRIMQHIRNASKIGEAIIKYGIENFDIDIIDTADSKNVIDIAEKKYIAKYDAITNGYNTLKGGTPDKEELKQIQKYKTSENYKHTRRYLRIQIEKKEKEFREQRTKRFNESLQKGSTGTVNISSNKVHNKYVLQEKELAESLGINTYVKWW